MSNDKFKAVQLVLNRHWNPIGLNNLADDDDEYEDYARHIISRIWQRDELIDYLVYTAADTIGMGYGPLRQKEALSAVDKILAALH